MMGITLLTPLQLETLVALLETQDGIEELAERGA